MLRGDLSNRPQSMYGVDYRVLIEPSVPYKWFLKNIPELLTNKFFERRMTEKLPYRPGAIEWMENNWDKRLVLVSVGEEVLGRALDMVVSQYITESRHHGDIFEFRRWVQTSRMIECVVTEDPTWMPYSDAVIMFGGFDERIGHVRRRRGKWG